MYSTRVEKRQDPYNNDPRSVYSFDEFVSYYGPAQGRELWFKARPANTGPRPGRVSYSLGQKVRALTKLQGDKGQVVMKGDIGEVTALPGRGSTISDPLAVAEVLISGVRFDAQHDMIEPVTHTQTYPQRAPRADYQSGYNDRGRSSRGAGEERPPRDGRKGGKKGVEREEERRRDPSDPKSNKTYTRRDFIEHYGKEKGLATWRQAGGEGAAKPRRAERRPDPTEKGSRKTYERHEFITLYGPKKGAQLWEQAGGASSEVEKRRDPNEPQNRQRYTQQEFIQHYGEKKGLALWNGSERRPDPNEKNGTKTYAKKEFLELYGKEEGLRVWNKAGKAREHKETGQAADQVVEDKKVVVKIEKTEEEKIGWSRDGVHIIEVDENSPAAKAGIKANYRIQAINDKKANLKNLTSLVKGAGNAFDVTLVQLRQDPSDPKGSFFTFSEFCRFYGPAGPAAWKRAAGVKAKDHKEKKAKDSEEKAEPEKKEEKEEETPAKTEEKPESD